MKTNITVIYILGSGHCGSTLLDMLLSGHSKVVGVGEMHHLGGDEKKLLCTCSKKPKECPLWSSILENKSFEGLQIYRTKKDTLLNNSVFKRVNNKERVNNQNYIELHENLYKSIAERADAGVVVDSSKSPERVALLSQSNQIEPIILHLVRDGRAVCWSYYKKYKKMLPFAWKWFATNKKVELLRERTDLKYIFVSYSELTKNPKKEIKRILRNINLDFEEDILNFRNHEHHQVGGNRMRFGKSGEIKKDMAWQKNMPLWQRIVFNTLFGWLNFYYKIKKYN